MNIYAYMKTDTGEYPVRPPFEDCVYVKPTSVVVNWKGAALGEKHATQISELPAAKGII